MGFINYAGRDFEIDDLVLAHVKAAVGVKLRRQESFYLNWPLPLSQGSGRITLWVSPNVPLQFRFKEPEPAQLNAVWVKSLVALAGSFKGMTIITEKQAEAYAREHHLG